MLSSLSVRRWSLLVLVAILIVLLIAVVALLVWARTGLMQAEEAPWETVRSDPNLSVHEDDTAIVLRPAQDEPAGMGLAFYPGAKVEATAYASRLPGVVAQGGMTVVIIKPWLDLALFDRRDLDTFTQQAPEIGSWIVGGHSLGAFAPAKWQGTPMPCCCWDPTARATSPATYRPSAFRAARTACPPRRRSPRPPIGFPSRRARWRSTGRTMPVSGTTVLRTVTAGRSSPMRRWPRR